MLFVKFNRGVAQPGSAFGLGPKGHRFESGLPDFLRVTKVRTSGYGVVVAHDPSKVLARVRISLPAQHNGWQKLSVF